MPQQQIEFVWSQGSHSSVFITGPFDNWQASVPMTQDKANKRWTAKVALPSDTVVLFKFVVDGKWRTSDNYPTHSDAAGNINNRRDLAVENAGVSLKPTTIVLGKSGVQEVQIAESFKINHNNYTTTSDPNASKGTRRSSKDNLSTSSEKLNKQTKQAKPTKTKA